MDRKELAAFLRSRRDRIRPAEVGLPAGGTRRAPGLRRQEVAQLAGISVEYYAQMEQARGAKPSRQVLAALARALLFTIDERDYLYRLAGENPPSTVGPNPTVPQPVLVMLAGMTTTPAYVVDATYEILAWNRMAIPFIGDLATVPAEDRNMIRWIFRLPAEHTNWDDASAVAFAHTTVTDLRAAYARYPGHPRLARLVTELLGTSPRFTAMWDTHDVEVRRTHRKRVVHPGLGPLDFDCQVLHISDTDQRMIVYCPDPDSPTEAVFRELSDRMLSGGPAIPG